LKRLEVRGKKSVKKTPVNREIFVCVCQTNKQNTAVAVNALRDTWTVCFSTVKRNKEMSDSTTTSRPPDDDEKKTTS